MPFIAAPWLVVIPGFLFLYFGNQRDKFGVMLTGGLWLVYGLYENWLKTNCTGECNIRFDLVLIYPVLAIFTIGSIVSLMRQAPKKRRRRARD